MALLRRYYIDKRVFFEVYDNGLVILKARGREIARKALNPGVRKSQVEEAFRIETMELGMEGVVASVYGFKPYWKPSLGKMVLRQPYAHRGQKKKKQNHKRPA